MIVEVAAANEIISVAIVQAHERTAAPKTIRGHLSALSIASVLERVGKGQYRKGPNWQGFMKNRAKPRQRKVRVTDAEVYEAIKEGGTNAQIAQRFNVSIPLVNIIKRRLRGAGYDLTGYAPIRSSATAETPQGFESVIDYAARHNLSTDKANKHLISHGISRISIGTPRRLYVAAGLPYPIAPHTRPVMQTNNRLFTTRHRNELTTIFGSRTDREAQIMEKWLEGQTLERIAKPHNLTRERVRQIIDKALDAFANR